MGIPSSAAAANPGSPPAGDQATNVWSGAFTATGQSTAMLVYGTFNLFVYGGSGPNGAWNGSVQLERSFDGGTTWVVCGVGGGGAQAVYTTATGADVSVVASEPERGMLYRVNCTAQNNAGEPINWRLSATGVLATTNGIPIG